MTSKPMTAKQKADHFKAMCNIDKKEVTAAMAEFWDDSGDNYLSKITETGGFADQECGRIMESLISGSHRY